MQASPGKDAWIQAPPHLVIPNPLALCDSSPHHLWCKTPSTLHSLGMTESEAGREWTPRGQQAATVTSPQPRGPPPQISNQVLQGVISEFSKNHSLVCMSVFPSNQGQWQECIAGKSICVPAPCRVQSEEEEQGCR